MQIKIDANTERKLVGQTAFVVDKSGGSFHERWGRMYVYVIVTDLVSNPYYDDETPEAERLNYNSFPDNEYKNIVKFFKFQSAKQAAEILEELEPRISFPVQPGEDRDTYWQRVMKSVGTETPPDPTGYNSSDDYYKKK